MNFQKLTEYLDQLHEVGIPGCDMAVYQDHKLLYRHCAGHRDHEKKQPMQGNETYCLYSCTKVFTTCAVMQLVEKGLIGLDDPVSNYLPEYDEVQVKDENGAHPARNVMLIRHLMSMQAGLDYDLHAPAIDALVEETKGEATTRQIAAAIAKKPLQFEPGSMYQYSLAHDVLAAIVEVVSGKKFSEYLHRTVGGKTVDENQLGQTAGIGLDKYIVKEILNELLLVVRNDTHRYYRQALFHSPTSGHTF